MNEEGPGARTRGFMRGGIEGGPWVGIDEVLGLELRRAQGWN